MIPMFPFLLNLYEKVPNRSRQLIDTASLYITRVHNCSAGLVRADKTNSSEFCSCSSLSAIFFASLFKSCLSSQSFPTAPPLPLIGFSELGTLK